MENGSILVEYFSRCFDWNGIRIFDCTVQLETETPDSERRSAASYYRKSFPSIATNSQGNPKGVSDFPQHHVG
jgi:hypothetical protein